MRKLIAMKKAQQGPSRPLERPNRIKELTKGRRWTYPDVAERVRELAKQHGDKERLKTHEVTINRLATGAMVLTQEWMNTLGEVFGVAPTEILAARATTPPTGDGKMRRVTVQLAAVVGRWGKSSNAWTDGDRFEIMIPSEAALAAERLYAVRVEDLSMNLRYPLNSIVILSEIDGQYSADVAPGRRYHVRITRGDLVEDTIKTLTVDAAGKYWLKTESDQPQFQAWTPLAGDEGTKVHLIGRVRGVYRQED